MEFFVGQSGQTCEARVKAFQFRIAHRLEIDAGSLFDGLRALHPTQKDLRSPRIGDGAFAQTSFDVSVRRRPVFTAP